MDPKIRVAHLEDSVLGTEAEDWLDRYLYFNTRDCNWETLKSAFIRHFADDFARDTAFYKMEARMMSENEPVKAYVDSKLALLVRYDPDMKVQDQILHIENGLLPKYKEMLFNFTYDDLEALTQHLTRAEGKINRHLRTLSKAKETPQSAPKVQIQETPVASMVTKEEFANFQTTMINAFQQLSFASNSKGDKKNRPPTPYRSDRSSSRSTAASGRSTDREGRDKKYKSKKYSHYKDKQYSKHKGGHQSKKDSHYKDKKYSKSKSSYKHKKHAETSGDESSCSHGSHRSSRDPTPDNKKQENHSKSKNGKK